MIACIYKSDNASFTSFSKLLSFLESYIDEIADSDSYTKIILGGFNLPNMWKYNCENMGNSSESEKLLLNFMNKFFLCQYVDVKTREENILDLLLTNNDRLVHHVQSEKHEISDHNVVEVLIPNSVFEGPSMQTKPLSVQS